MRKTGRIHGDDGGPQVVRASRRSCSVSVGRQTRSTSVSETSSCVPHDLTCVAPNAQAAQPVRQWRPARVPISSPPSDLGARAQPPSAVRLCASSSHGFRRQRMRSHSAGRHGRAAHVDEVSALTPPDSKASTDPVDRSDRTSRHRISWMDREIDPVLLRVRPLRQLTSNQPPLRSPALCQILPA